MGSQLDKLRVLSDLSRCKAQVIPKPMLTFLPNKVTVSIALTAVSLSLTPIISVSGAAQAAPAANSTSKPLSKGAHSQHSAHPESLAKTHDAHQLMELGLKCYAQGKFPDAYNDFHRATISKGLAPIEHIKALIAAGDSAYQNGDYQPALSYLKRAHAILQGSEKKQSTISSAVAQNAEREELLAETSCDIGEVLYELDRHTDSQPYFEHAINSYKSGKVSEEVLLRSLEGLGASYFKDRQYAKALPLYQEVAYLDRQRYGADATPYGWTLRVLSDLHTKLNQKQQAKACFDRSIWIFRNANYVRLVRHWTHVFDREKAAATNNTANGNNAINAPKILSAEALKKAIYERAFGDLGDIPDITYLKPGSHTGLTTYPTTAKNPIGIDSAPPTSTLPWQRARIAVMEPASTIWADPRQDILGIVVCVPGFGLHKHSFKDLGESLSQRGYVVFSYDVRGFGAYTALKARDRIDLEKSLDDLDDSIIAIRDTFPQKPVFLLGESMGGSMALQFCAQHPELVEGLIAAVPSEQRYSQWLTSTKVALSLLTGSRKLIDVSTVVVKRATQDKDLRTAWSEDPESRMTATAKELLGFKSFLSRNHILARQVKTTPVLMYQGVHDLLIRPEGTIKLFKAIGNDDKNLVLIGKSEHLVFEEGQFKVTLLESLLDWMKNHSTLAQPKSTGTNTGNNLPAAASPDAATTKDQSSN